MATATKAPPAPPMGVSKKLITMAEEYVKADAEVGKVKGDFAQAKAEASKKAVLLVVAASKEGVDLNQFQRAMLSSGVLKGTVSKMTTVVRALNDGTIIPSDVKTLNKAYTALKSISKITAAAGAAAAAAAAAGTTGAPGTSAPVKITGKEGLKAIVAEIKAIADPDERFKAIGDWTTMFSTEMSRLVKSTGVDEDE